MPHREIPYQVAGCFNHFLIPSSEQDGNRGTQSFRQQCLPNFFAINFPAAESAISLIKSPLRLNIKAPLIFRLSHVNAPVFSLNCIAEGACKLQVDHLPNHFGAAEIKKATEAVLGSEYSNQVQLPTYSKHIKSLLRNHTWTNDGQGSTSFSQRSALASAMATDPKHGYENGQLCQLMSHSSNESSGVGLQ